jgi:hypothetical protein
MLLSSRGTTSMLIKLLSGLFMMFTLLSPLLSVRLKEFTQHWEDLSLYADSAVSEGLSLAQAERETIIIQQAEAYILQKADSLGVELSAEVLLSDGIPDAVNISGAASPYVKMQLGKWISDNLGIKAEAQYWNE